MTAARLSSGRRDTDASALSVSVIVPVWRADRSALPALLATLAGEPHLELIVAIPSDEIGGYDDLAREHAHVRWCAAPRGRASQMNAGAAAASGEWLVFLHADTLLPSGWRLTLAQAGAARCCVGGSFRFTLSSRAWQARILEAGVRLRVRWLGLPYGDQALFARRVVFESIGGYSDLPLMEDIDLVRRLRRAGALFHSDQAVTTSARRWEREGWFRRSARNLGLASLYHLGVSPRWLARRYAGRHPIALVMFARAPWHGGKSRLVPASLSPDDHAALRIALFEDTLDALRAVPGVDLYVACEPAACCEPLRARLGAGVDVIAQHDGDLGARMEDTIRDLFRLGAAGVILVGSDLPDLPPAHVSAAVQALSRQGDRVVLGPSADGGYYLIGLKAPHPELFGSVPWSTDAVLDVTLALARAAAIPVVGIPAWRDVDTWDDLMRLRAPGASRTRAWAAEAEGSAATPDATTSPL